MAECALSRLHQLLPKQKCGNWDWIQISSRRKRARLSCLLRRSFGGEFLPCQFGAEFLFLLGYVLFVATRIDERVPTPLFHKRVLFFESEVIAMGTEENIARQ